MSRLLTRTTVFPVWLLVFGITAMSLPLTFNAAMLLLLVGVGVPAIVLMVWKDTPPTVAEVLHAAEIENREQLAAPDRRQSR